MDAGGQPLVLALPVFRPAVFAVFEEGKGASEPGEYFCDRLVDEGALGVKEDASLAALDQNQLLPFAQLAHRLEGVEVAHEGIDFARICFEVALDLGGRFFGEAEQALLERFLDRFHRSGIVEVRDQADGAHGGDGQKEKENVKFAFQAQHFDKVR